MPDRETGTVRMFDASRSYGDITRDQGGDIFVSYNSFRDKDDCFLVIGSRVEFIAVDSGGKALRLFEEENPDLVSLDISIPDINGIELLAYFKNSSFR